MSPAEKKKWPTWLEPSPDEPKTHLIGLRVSDSEYERLKAKAHAEGRTVAASAYFALTGAHPLDTRSRQSRSRSTPNEEEKKEQ